MGPGPARSLGPAQSIPNVKKLALGPGAQCQNFHLNAKMGRIQRQNVAVNAKTCLIVFWHWPNAKNLLFGIGMASFVIGPTPNTCVIPVWHWAAIVLGFSTC